MIHPLLHVHQQQAHIEQFALTAHQIQDASNIIQYHVGDKEDTISRLYQLQIAVDAHQFSDAEFTMIDIQVEFISFICSVNFHNDRYIHGYVEEAVVE
eukprot:306654_1